MRPVATETCGRRPRATSLCARVAIVVMLLSVGMAHGQVKTSPASASDKTKGAMLVNADDELRGFLDQARNFIAEGNYNQGISILHALILREDSGFVVGDEDRQYISLWHKANELIGRMPQAGLNRYRALYDPQAKQLYEEALATNDASILRRLVRRYLHTSFGAVGLDALAAIHFDRGQFFSAARYWNQSLRIDAERGDMATILAKLASAYHLAGDTAKAGQFAERLAEEYGGAEAVLAGKTQKVGDFLAIVMAMPSAAVEMRSGAARSWSGMSGSADGLAVMDESDVVLVPRWRSPSPLGQAGFKFPDDLIALKEQFGSFSRQNSNQQISGKLKGGQVKVVTNASGKRTTLTCPAVVHPVIVGDKILCRTGKALVAYDGLTGKEIWDTVDFFPLYRSALSLGGGQYGGGSYYGGVAQVGDRGWQTVTVGEGLAFVLGNFRSLANSRMATRAMTGRPGANTAELQKKMSDTSSLAAFSIDHGGRSVWVVGYGAGGDSELLRGCKFVGAPTYHSGRLYVLATFRMNSYAICLDAANGTLVWQSLISQLPGINMSRYGFRLAHLLESGSSPAVADGQVFVVTNAGVIAALDAETGQGMWAYEYESTTARYIKSRYYSNRSALFYPPNPVIVSRGQVICLPADSNNVLALSTETGRMLWQADRRQQHDLSAVDSRRVLLSGKGLVVLSTVEAGQVLFSEADKGILGRPAVTASRILASAQGKLITLTLDGYQLEARRLGSADGMLGNLVSFSGKLVAANAAGLCGYFDYDKARQLLTDRMRDSAPKLQPGMLFQRGQLAFNAKRFGQALEDLTVSARQAGEWGDEQLPLSVRPWLYRTRVALANHADSDERMLEEFKLAGQLAATDQERAHMLLRIAKSYERSQQYVIAVDKLQELSDKYGDEELVDVMIGPKADDTARFDEDSPRSKGKVLAQARIGRLIKEHGREVYAKFDDMAHIAIMEAIRADDPDAMVVLVRRWQHCSSADHALMEAGEIYYRRALALYQRSRNLTKQADSTPGNAVKLAGEADGLFVRSVDLLAELATRRESPLRLKANIALAVIYAHSGYSITLGLKCDEIRYLCRPQGMDGYDLGSQVAFGEYSGTVDSVLKLLESGRYPDKALKPLPLSLNLPLETVFTLADPEGRILRDQNYRAPRLGSNVFVLRETNVFMLNMAAGNARDAVRWRSPVGLVEQVTRASSFPYPPGWRLVAGMSDDAEVLLVADTESVIALDVRTGKNLWRRSMGQFGISAVKCMSVGSGMLVVGETTGRLTAINMVTGEVLWRSKNTGHGSLLGPPQIGAGIVICTNQVGRDYFIRAYNAESGKLVGKWIGAANSWQSVITDEGFVVLMLNGQLSLREASNLNGPPVWTRKYVQNQYPAILGTSGDRLVVSPNFDSGQVEVLSMTNRGQLLADFTTANTDGQANLPVDVWFSGETLMVGCTSSRVKRRKVTYHRYSSVRDMILQGFDLSGKIAKGTPLSPLWVRKLDNDDKVYGVIAPSTVTQSHIVIFHKFHQTNIDLYVRVVDIRNGDLAGQIDLIGKAGDIKARTIARRRIGPPVVAGGRLCVETCEGITVYGSQ